jgi:riboflavin synthase
MFTGIVAEVGEVRAVSDSSGGRVLSIDAPRIAAGLRVGESVAVNGVCLTAVAVDTSRFEVEVVPESLKRSNLGTVRQGSAVDLERPLAAGGRFDGHVVQGHVDAVATIRSIDREGDSIRMWLDLGSVHLRYVVEKGSVALDGVSLTVSAVDAGGFEVVLIPHTLDRTVFGTRAVGEEVNVEVDILAKYVERLLEARP